MCDNLSIRLREEGAVLLRGVFASDSLTQLKAAAELFFQAMGRGSLLPERYRYNRFSNSVLLSALADFGRGAGEALQAPLSAPALRSLLSETTGPAWTCNMEQSWVRKKFAPHLAPASGYHLQGWHQDGALGVSFPLEPGQVIPMTDLLTCWIPLDRCGADNPGLEFIRRRQPALLHFTELDDSALRQRFPPGDFWSPALEFGDGLVFLNDILHRTYVHSGMQHDRMSIEYRMMPGERLIDVDAEVGSALK